MNGEEGKPYVPIGGPLNICNTCTVKHYDNCEGCWGFGVSPNSTPERIIPISAEEAGDKIIRLDGGNSRPMTDADWKPCPICKSTPAGIPVETES